MIGSAQLYGTEQPPDDYETITYGGVSLGFQSGAFRHIRVNGVEAIRSVAFLVRDRDWGTIQPELGEIIQTRGDDLRLTQPMRFRNGTSQLVITVTARITSTGLTVTAEGEAKGDFETNRAGFTLLHPIDGVAGAPAIVTHSDGRQEAGNFPLLIEPWQPFMDIAALEHRANGLAVRCAFSGDIFEMEDQRQWGDASFKTYNRPLALPWPYLLKDGEKLRQTVDIRWHKTGFAKPAEWPALPAGPHFPRMALALSAGDALLKGQVIAAVESVGPQALLCHVDAAAGQVAPQFAAFAALQSELPDLSFDLELICRFGGAETPETELTDHGRAMSQSGFTPASVFVCPSVDRQSTPPGSEWPECPPLAEIHAAAARAFPELARGGGMASFFPELNRKRPPVELLDFIMHGLCPIVHAADDLSVMETLEAVPHIAASARAIAAGQEYRIGPATIAMRQNPYGSRTIPNPGHARICMTDDDPRHRGAFGAAYALGLATALAPHDIAVWTPAAVLGARGISGSWPIVRVLRQLAALTGKPVRSARIRNGVATLEVGDHQLRANLTAHENDGLDAFGWEAAGIVKQREGG
ncbi:hypothetical protein [Paracoccus onubensis]|uniref:Uncharacterized protein n=1 Tax=Paracoccus onubensis TaxID=1675788 RepID=A0A418T088_9RHOB|nr:hypothetical protein [Paracoccus onubensis]RJE86593.1 hypothetical protein D3P04_07735 [Paracoccus onubensis]